MAQETSFNSPTSQQVPRYQRQHSAGGSITQQQLATALAGAMGSVQSAPLSSLDLSSVRASRYTILKRLTIKLNFNILVALCAVAINNYGLRLHAIVTASEIEF